MKTSKSIPELNAIICDAVGISIEKYDSMTISEKFKVRSKYVRIKNSNK
jgi:hypothetical protein